MNLITELLKCLNDIDYRAFGEDDLNELLDSRDRAPFDAEWCRVDTEIKALKNDQNYTAEIAEKQGIIREKAFMIMEQHTQSELSDYVSDDFGLIYDSLVLNYKDEWLHKLMEEYKNKKIPAGEL